MTEAAGPSRAPARNVEITQLGTDPHGMRCVIECRRPHERAGYALTAAAVLILLVHLLSFDSWLSYLTLGIHLIAVGAIGIAAFGNRTRIVVAGSHWTVTEYPLPLRAARELTFVSQVRAEAAGIAGEAAPRTRIVAETSTGTVLLVPYVDELSAGALVATLSEHCSIAPVPAQQLEPQLPPRAEF